MRQLSASLLLMAAGVLAVPSLIAQPTPVTDEFPLCAGEANCLEDYYCGITSATGLPDGRFAIGFSRSFQPGSIEDDDCGDHVRETWVELLDTSGISVGTCGGASGSREFDFYPDHAAAAGSSGDRVIAAWDALDYNHTSLFVDWCAPGHPGSEEPLSIADPANAWSPQIAANAAGRMVLAWERCTQCDLNLQTAIGVQAFDSTLKPVTPILLLDPREPAHESTRPAVGIDTAGRFLVLWMEESLRGQRFGRDGRRLGSGFQIAEGGSLEDYAVLADGSIVAAWRTRVPAPDRDRLWLRRYTMAGLAATQPVVVAEPASSIQKISISADRRGNLALLWREGDLPRARLYNRDLVPQGAAFAIGPSGVLDEAIALSDTGRLFTAHNHRSPGQYYDALYPLARLWQARHEADACVRRGQLFLCDTANDGGAAEARLPLGQGVAQETSFLADWDGDGRADPCLYRNGQFFCDTGHDGGTDVRSPTVGTAGDKPLLGDLNGDGKADPCVRRGAAVLCDLARDGGAKDLRIAFGVSSDKVLLGDPDGDGRDDPCILRSGRLLCDTAHDGNLAEMRLDLRPLAAQGATLLGDVNGDGRDEACRFTGDRFVCGVYPATPAAGGAPTSILEIVFGQPGDLPLLGDLDAF
jgi:hypothetical protein